MAPAGWELAGFGAGSLGSEIGWSSAAEGEALGLVAVTKVLASVNTALRQSDCPAAHDSRVGHVPVRVDMHFIALDLVPDMSQQHWPVVSASS